jgi:hypothetical protein
MRQMPEMGLPLREQEEMVSGSWLLLFQGCRKTQEEGSGIMRININKILTVLAATAAIVVLINAVYIAFSYRPKRAYNAEAEWMRTEKAYKARIDRLHAAVTERDATIAGMKEREKRIHGVLLNLQWMSRVSYPAKPDTLVEMLNSYQSRINDGIKLLEGGEP